MRKRTLGIFVSGALLLLAAACTPAPVLTPRPIDGWQRTGQFRVNQFTSGQGVASLPDGQGGRALVFANSWSIPFEKYAAGWNHVGDPGAWDRFVVYPYESQQLNAKMFNVVTPTGASFDYVHALAPGEAFNNSFTSVSPNGQWIVSGEWNEMQRLLVFPMPMLNKAVPAGGGALALATTIQLDRPVRRVQGCAFFNATRLLCSTDDARTDLNGVEGALLQVDLDRPIDGSAVTGRVSVLGPVPHERECTGEYETQGIDYDAVTGVMRVVVIPPAPCSTEADVYEYVAA